MLLSLIAGYVPDAEIGIEILKRRDRRFARAYELLRAGRFEEGVRLLSEAGLDRDRILFFVATVLQEDLGSVEQRVDAVLKLERRFVESGSPVEGMIVFSEVMPTRVVRGKVKDVEERFEYLVTYGNIVI